MRDRIIEIMLFGIRGSVHAIPFLLLGLLFMSGLFSVEVDPSIMLSVLSNKINFFIKLAGLGLGVAGFFVFIFTWIDDYANDYLPNWVLRDL